MTTNAELRTLAKEKNLLCEVTKGLYHAYIHIKADDEEGLEGKPPDDFMVTIMVPQNEIAEKAAREAARAAIKDLPKFEVKKRRKKQRKIFDNESEIEDNVEDSFESETQVTVEQNLAATLY